MKKRFIILVDFSEYSSNLIKFASDWANQVNAELLVIHKTNILTPAMTDYNSKVDFIKHTNYETLEKLSDFVSGLLSPYIEVSYKVTEKSLIHTLTKLLSQPFDNLIFLGIKGTGLLKKNLNW